MKKVLLLAALALGFVSANAQKLTVTGTVNEGAGTVAFNITDLPAENLYCAIQFDVKFPEGLTPDMNKLTQAPKATKGEALDPDAEFSIGASAQKDELAGYYRFVIYNPINHRFDEGIMFTTKVTATESFAGGSVDIKNTIIALGADENGVIDPNGAVKQTDFEAISLPIKIGESGFATIASPFEIKLPSTAKAYSASLGTNEVVLENASEKVAAGVPAILNGTANMIAISSESTELSNTGILKGVFEATPITSGYVLSNGTFQNVSTSATVPAYKAYLDTTSEIKGFRFADDATAINGVNANAGAKAIYGVNGAARSSMVKGINIVKNADGTVSKVLVK